ncbi:MAG: hypothetical protein HGA75_14615 [Thiobacillus sp.]|nr:hypothetical protein [Thiobacillus sp.]
MPISGNTPRYGSGVEYTLDSQNDEPLPMKASKLIIPFLAAVSTASSALEINKDVLLDRMEFGLAKSFCEESSIFMSCFSVTKERCAISTRIAVAICRHDLKDAIPDVITTREEAKLLGNKVGECAGKRFAANNRSYAVMSEMCRASLVELFNEATLSNKPLQRDAPQAARP